MAIRNPVGIKLKRCPWCGGEAAFIGGAGYHAVRCTECGKTNERLNAPPYHGVYYDAYATVENAAKDWNKRKKRRKHGNG